MKNKIKRKQKGKSTGQFFGNSLIIRFFLWLSDFFYSKMIHSKTAQALSSYSDVGECYEQSFLKKIVSKLWFKPSKRLLMKNKFQRVIENSFFYRVFSSFANLLLSLKARVYGVILFIYGFCTVSTGFIKTYISVSHDSDFFLIFQGVALIFVGFLLLFSKSDTGSLLANGKITGFVLRKLVGIKKEKLIRAPINENTVIPMLIGLLFGLTSILIDPIYVIVALLALVYVCMVFHRPEFGIIVTAVTVPFMPTMLICAEIILVFIAFLLKVMRGKRSVSYGPLDVAVLTFGVFMLFGGIFSVSVSTSLPAVCVFICFMLSYFLIVNLIKSFSTLKKMILLFSLSYLICSALGVWQNFFGVADTTWTDIEMFEGIETRVVSTFENPNVFGEYLIIMAPMIFSLFLIEKGFKRKSVPALGFIVGCMALVFTWSRGAWLGFVFSLLLYFVIINKKTIAVFFAGIAALPFLYPYLPASFQGRIESIGDMADSSTSYRVYIWEASWNMLKDWWFSGIGVGTGAFGEVYPLYSLAGIETAPHSHNLYFQIFLELGIFGFLAFLAVLFFAAAKCCTYLARGSQKNVKLISSASLMGLVAILIQGLTDYVWYNYRVFLIFWIVLAVMSVSIDLAKREDQRTANDEDIISGGKNEKSEISIQI